MSFKRGFVEFWDGVFTIVVLIATAALFLVVFYKTLNALDEDLAGAAFLMAAAVLGGVWRGASHVGGLRGFPRWFARQLFVFGVPLVILVVGYKITVALDPYNHNELYKLIPIGLSGIIYICLIYTVFKDPTPAPLEKQHLRGPQLFPFPEVEAKAKAELPARDPGLQWGGVLLPSSAAQEHFLVAGRTKSGKTVTLNLLMRSVLPRLGDATTARALVYDPKTEVLSDLVRMGLSSEQLVIMNPFDSRCYAWDIAADLREQAAIDELASLLFPRASAKSDNSFFEDAAANFLAGVMTSFAEAWPTEKMARVRPTKQWTLRDVLLAVRSGHYLRQVLAWDPDDNGPLLGNLLNRPRKSIDDVMATVTNKLKPYQVIASCWAHAQEEGRAISLDDWAKTEGRVLVLGRSTTCESALASINRVLVHRLSQLLLDRVESDPKKTWLFLDELGALCEQQGIPKLGALLREGRTKGVVVVLGFQDVGALVHSFGKDLTPGLLGQVGNKAILRLESKEDAEWAQGLFGEIEENVPRESVSQSSGQQGPTITMGEQYHLEKRPLVPFSEFQNIPKLDEARGAGLGGFYRSASLDMSYRYELELDVLKKLPRPTAADIETNFQRRPPEHQKLRAWSPKELEALGLRPEPPYSPPDLDSRPQRRPEEGDLDYDDS